MTQQEIDHAVAQATGESIAMVRDLGFGIADAFEVQFDPEPRHPQVLDWDQMAPTYWGHC